VRNLRLGVPLPIRPSRPSGPALLPSFLDLSPPENLQLVEDLWDDLAGVPEAVPVHEWQKEELDRRKANLMKNPAFGVFSWK